MNEGHRGRKSRRGKGGVCTYCGKSHAKGRRGRSDPATMSCRGHKPIKAVK